MTQINAKWNVPQNRYHMLETIENMEGRQAFDYMKKADSSFKPKFGGGMFRDAVDFNMEYVKNKPMKFTVAQRRGYKVLEFTFA